MTPKPSPHGYPRRSAIPIIYCPKLNGNTQRAPVLQRHFGGAARSQLPRLTMRDGGGQCASTASNRTLGAFITSMGTCGTGLKIACTGAIRRHLQTVHLGRRETAVTG